MPLIPSPDIIVFTNFVLSIIIVSLSLWGYRVIEKATPLYIGLAYTLFATTHMILLFSEHPRSSLWSCGSQDMFSLPLEYLQ